MIGPDVPLGVVVGKIVWEQLKVCTAAADNSKVPSGDALRGAAGAQLLKDVVYAWPIFSNVLALELHADAEHVILRLCCRPFQTRNLGRPTYVDSSEAHIDQQINIAGTCFLINHVIFWRFISCLCLDYFSLYVKIDCQSLFNKFSNTISTVKHVSFFRISYLTNPKTNFNYCICYCPI